MEGAASEFAIALHAQLVAARGAEVDEVRSISARRTVMKSNVSAVLFSLLLASGAAKAESISLIHDHGTLVAPVVLNDKVTLNFIIDSGASDVSIPADVYSTLIRTGTVTISDLLDTREYELADGSKQTSQRFRIRSLRIGNLELRNVIASVAPSAGALLLGQSVLSRLKSWSIDNDRQLLVFSESTDAEVAPADDRPKVRPGIGTPQVPSQSALPMDTDLHAAYCIEVIRNDLVLAESVLTEGNSLEAQASSAKDAAALQASNAKLEASNREVKAGIDSSEANLRMLKFYIALRINQLNPMSLVVAQKAARDDIATVNSAAAALGRECPAPASAADGSVEGYLMDAYIRCSSESINRPPQPEFRSIHNKWQSCRTLDWLSF